MDDLESAIDTLHAINLEMCMTVDYYCHECEFRINGTCIVQDAQSVLNIIIRQYRECHRKSKSLKEVKI